MENFDSNIQFVGLCFYRNSDANWEEFGDIKCFGLVINSIGCSLINDIYGLQDKTETIK